MESWLKGIVAFLSGAVALYWHPWLESAQNSITESLDVSGQVVTLIWLTLTFVWTFVGALMGYTSVATIFFLLNERRSLPGSQQYLENLRP